MVPLHHERTRSPVAPGGVEFVATIDGGIGRHQRGGLGECDEEIDAIGAGDDVVHVSPFLSYLFDSADEELVAGI